MPYILCGGHTVTTNDDGTFSINVQSPNGKKADYAAYTIGPFGTGFDQAGEYTAQRWDTSDVNRYASACGTPKTTAGAGGSRYSEAGSQSGTGNSFP